MNFIFNMKMWASIGKDLGKDLSLRGFLVNELITI